MKLKYKFVINKVDGDYIAIPLETKKSFSGYIKINQTAKDILEMLNSDIDREGLISALSDKYPDAKVEEIEESVDETVKKLSAAGLII